MEKISIKKCLIFRIESTTLKLFITYTVGIGVDQGWSEKRTNTFPQQLSSKFLRLSSDDE